MWFLLAAKNYPLLPQCFICLMQLTNASMKPDKLYLHLIMCHPSLANIPKEYHVALSECVCSSSSELKGFLIERNSASGLTASYNIAFLIVKQVRPHTIAEDLMEAYKLANYSYPQSILRSIPLSNNATSSCITDMADDVKSILIQDLRCSNIN